jgi:hypothetical protein
MFLIEAVRHLRNGAGRVLRALRRPHRDNELSHSSFRKLLKFSTVVLEISHIALSVVNYEQRLWDTTYGRFEPKFR